MCITLPKKSRCKCYRRVEDIRGLFGAKQSKSINILREYRNPRVWSSNCIGITGAIDRFLFVIQWTAVQARARLEHQLPENLE